MHFKLFNEYAENINEGSIRVFPPGDFIRPISKFHINNKQYTNGITWKAFYDIVPKWLDEGYPMTVITTDFVFGSKTGYNTKITSSEYRSKVNGTWNDKTLPKFLDINPNYNEVEFDIIKIDKKLMNDSGVFIQDKYGNEFCIHSSKIMDIQLGSSIKDDIQAGSCFIIDGMRARITNYQNGIITVSFKYGSKDPDDYREYTLEEWKSKRYTSLDESKNIDDDYVPMKYYFNYGHKKYAIHQAKTNPSKFGTKTKNGKWEVYAKNDEFNPKKYDMEPAEFLKWIQRGVKYFYIRSKINRRHVIDSEWKELFKRELAENKPINKRLAVFKMQCGRRNAKWHIYYK